MWNFSYSFYTIHYFYTMEKYLPEKVRYCDEIYTIAENLIYNKSTVTPIFYIKIILNQFIFHHND